MPRVRWTKEKILEAIDDWVFINEDEPRPRDWMRETGGSYPTSVTVRNHFGSWTAAIDAYREFYSKNGMPPRHGAHNPWTREDVIAAFQEWHDEFGLPPTVLDSRNNAGKRRRLPSPSVVANLFGSWNEGIEAAGFVPLPQGASRKAVKKYLPMPRKR